MLRAMGQVGGGNWRTADGGRCCLRAVLFEMAVAADTWELPCNVSVCCVVQVVHMDEDDEVVFGHGRSRLGASLKALANSPSPAYVALLPCVPCSVDLGPIAHEVRRIERQATRAT